MNFDKIKEGLAAGEISIVPMIETHGELPTVVHTVGMTQLYNKPELIIVGPAGFDKVRQILGLVQYCASAYSALVEPLLDGESLPLPPGIEENLKPGVKAPPLTVKDVLSTELENFPLPAFEHVYPERTDIKFQQVVLADMEGKMPWEEGYEPMILGAQKMFWTEGGVENVMPSIDTHSRKDSTHDDLAELAAAMMESSTKH